MALGAVFSTAHPLQNWPAIGFIEGKLIDLPKLEIEHIGYWFKGHKTFICSGEKEAKL